MAGIYLHIPFCKTRCIYCDFYSTNFHELKNKYIKALEKEMLLRKDYINENISTIYIGGGTPSQLSIKQLELLFKSISNNFSLEEDLEVTLECNPDDVNEEFAFSLKNLPVNRVSLGVETFSNKHLKFLRRRHTAQDAVKAVNLLKNIGTDNISIDLMFGLPNETLDELIYDINRALELKVQHISAYNLTYEENTILWQMLQKGEVKELDESLLINMYEEITSRLEASGYKRYEISNFSKKGFSSRHNSAYWRQVPYIGLGAGAHSFNLTSREWNISDVKEYIMKINEGILPSEKEILDPPTMFNDLISRALRTQEGIDLNYVASKMEKKYYDYLINESKDAILQGLLIIEDDHLRLTSKGILLSNRVMMNLMIV